MPVSERDAACEVFAASWPQRGSEIQNADATLLRSLLTAGLVDELRLFLHPLVLGSGERLFDNSQRRIALTLAEFHAYDNGVVALHYQPTKR